MTINIFKEVSIEHLCTRVTSGSTPHRSNRRYYKDGTVDWYKTGELRDWYLGPAEERITDLALKETSVKVFPANTVLMAMYGDGKTITSLGILRTPAATNQACSAMIVDESKCDPHYFFYALKARRHLLLNMAYGGAQRNLTATLIKRFELLIPSLPIQHRISGILTGYDELIENNQRRIKILEEMARSLYREWFVKFRFPGHDKVKMVPSPLGPIPQGWEIKAVKEILARRPAGHVYREEDVALEGAVPVIDQSTSELLGFHDNEPDQLATPENPIAIFGDHTCKMQLLVEPFSIGPNVVAFAANINRPISYLFQVVRSLIQTQEYRRHWTQLTAKEIVLADKTTAEHFTTSIQPLLQQVQVLRKANRVLRRTRDLLLPRLISREFNLETST